MDENTENTFAAYAELCNLDNYQDIIDQQEQSLDYQIKF